MDFLYVAVLVCLCVCVLVAMCVAVHRTEIVSSFDRLHRRRQYRVQINRSVSAFHIASRVMRKDNYLIALMNKNMLDLSLPCCCRCSVPLTKTLEWNLHWTMLNHMFDVPTFQLRPEFLNDVPALQRRFVVFGILNFVLLPFTLLFMIMYFFLKNAEVRARVLTCTAAGVSASNACACSGVPQERRLPGPPQVVAACAVEVP